MKSEFPGANPLQRPPCSFLRKFRCWDLEGESWTPEEHILAIPEEIVACRVVERIIELRHQEIRITLQGCEASVAGCSECFEEHLVVVLGDVAHWVHGHLQLFAVLRAGFEVVVMVTWGWAG